MYTRGQGTVANALLRVHFISMHILRELDIIYFIGLRRLSFIAAARVMLQAPLLLMGLEEKAIYGETAEAADGEVATQEQPAKRQRTGSDGGSDSEVRKSHS